MLNKIQIPISVTNKAKFDSYKKELNMTSEQLLVYLLGNKEGKNKLLRSGEVM